MPGRGQTRAPEVGEPHGTELLGLALEFEVKGEQGRELEFGKGTWASGNLVRAGLSHPKKEQRGGEVSMSIGCS